MGGERRRGSAAGGRLRISLLLLCLAATATSPALSLRFELQSGQTKCISEDIKLNAMTVGNYAVLHPSPAVDAAASGGLPASHRVTLRVTSPYGNSMHYAEGVESGSFAFTAGEAGDYLACFWTPEHKPPVAVTFEFEWKSGVAAKDWTSVAKKGQVDFMELELKKLEDVVKAIHDEMFFLRAREEEMHDMNRGTNSTMAWLSFLSLALCLSVAGLQLQYLKTFFERKKLL